MKRILLILGTLAIGGAAFCVLNSSARSHQGELIQRSVNWAEQTQKLAEVQSEVDALSIRVRDLQAALPPVSRDATLIDLLSTNDFDKLSLENQGRLLSELESATHSADNFVFIPKSLLAGSQIEAFEHAPNASRLTSGALQTLAINSDEQKGVESAFAEALEREKDWAQAHMQRGGASNDLLVSYTVPVDTNFAGEVANHLYSNVSNILGAQRTELLRSYFDFDRIDEDGSLAVMTNKLMVYHVPGKTGLFYRAGWEMDGSSAINSDPEPIRTNRFPAAFRYIFPGGWQELAQREGLEFVEPPAEQK